MEIVTENATSLAWIGDAVMSLAVREHLLSLGFRRLMFFKRRMRRFVVPRDKLSC